MSGFDDIKLTKYILKIRQKNSYNELKAYAAEEELSSLLSTIFTNFEKDVVVTVSLYTRDDDNDD
jgi:hypothetical protein